MSAAPAESAQPAAPQPAVSADLLAVLACPSEDHAPLELAGDTLVCTFCGTSYPIRDGIPVLLVDDATPGPNGIGVGREPAADSAPAAP